MSREPGQTDDLPCWSLLFQWFTEDSDELWMRHCQRDFKRESPQEYESWREMYLRLHDEREERLRLLTQNISSAHANKPKGRRSVYRLKSGIWSNYRVMFRVYLRRTLSLQGGRLKWHLWILLPNRRVMSAADRRSSAPLVVCPRPPPPPLQLPSSQYSAASPVDSVLTFTIQQGPLSQTYCTNRRLSSLSRRYSCFICALTVHQGFPGAFTVCVSGTPVVIHITSMFCIFIYDLKYYLKSVSGCAWWVVSMFPSTLIHI